MAGISAKTEYGCLAMIDLGQRYASGEATRVGEMAQRHGMPAGFLVQILLQLKAAGLVRSSRGAGGGYRLARAPESITLQQIVEAIEGPAEGAVSHARRSSAGAAVLAATWEELRSLQQSYLAEVTLAALVERLEATPAEMYYI